MTNFFAKNLKYLREKKKLSQANLGDLAHVNQTTIMRWEQESMSPSIDNVEDLSNVLNVNVADLIGKDLEQENIKQFNELDELLFSKAKELSDEDKKTIIGVINAIKRDADKENNN